MTIIASISHFYEYKWEEIARAFWIRYPNPFAPHVISTDILSRWVDPDTEQMYTRRLITKLAASSALPRWAFEMLKSRATSASSHGATRNAAMQGFVIEDSIVDPTSSTLTTHTYNVSQAWLVKIEEWHKYVRDDEHPDRTSVTITGRVEGGKSRIARFCSTKLEKFVESRFHMQTHKSQQGFGYVLETQRAAACKLEESIESGKLDI